jgi:hypothetical protein
MKQHWNIVYSADEKLIASDQPIQGTREQAEAYMHCMYDVNNVKLVPLSTIDLDELKTVREGEIKYKVHHNYQHLFTYVKGELNHNMIEDEDDGDFLTWVEKEYFTALGI